MRKTERSECDGDGDGQGWIARATGCAHGEGRAFREGYLMQRRTHIVRFYTRSAVETLLRSSDQIGSTERVRSIGSTATAQIHGRPRDIPWPQSRFATRPSPIANTAPFPYIFSARCAGSQLRCAGFCIISSRLARIKVLPEVEEDFGIGGESRRYRGADLTV